MRLVAQGVIAVDKMSLTSMSEKRARNGAPILNADTGLQEFEQTKEPYALKCFMTMEQFQEKGMADR